MRIEGSTQLLGLVNLLQIAELNRRSYSIRLVRPGEEAILAVENGVLCHAAVGDAFGAVAMSKLCHWGDSHIEIMPLSYKPSVNITPDRSFLLNLGIQAMKAAFPGPPQRYWRVHGDIELLPPYELLQIFELNHLPVHIRFSSNKGTASIFVNDGEAVHAEITTSGTLQTQRPPAEILCELLTWTGKFEASIAQSFPERTVQEPLNYLILESMRLLDERMALPKERQQEEQAHATAIQQSVEEGMASDSVRSLVAKRYLARGRTAPVESLIKLSQDENERISQQALESISRLPLPIVKTLAGDKDTPDRILRHLVEEFWDDDSIMRPLAENPSASDETIGQLASFASDAVLAIITKDAARVARSDAIRLGIANRGDRQLKLKRKQEQDLKKRAGGSIHKRIMEMSLPDKIFLAFRGSAAERAILAQNPVKMVATAVLRSPKITDSEIENIASMKSVNSDVLEQIADNPQWINQYPIARAVACNPKTPVHISIDLLKRLREPDLHHIAKDHNLPEGLRASAARRLQIIEKKKGKK